MTHLRNVADELWVVERPLRFFGLEVGTRMTIVRLAGGGLFVHSPVALDADLRAEVDALGDVVAIVAPCKYHHLFVGEWSDAYPNATVSACPGLRKKRPDVQWTRALRDESTEGTEWRDDLEQVVFRALPIQNEVVFFHAKSRTMISSDVLFNLASHPSAVTRAVNRVAGTQGPGPTLLERLLIRDRASARAQIDSMLRWQPDRIVLAHGDLVTEGGKDALERAYRWL